MHIFLIWWNGKTCEALLLSQGFFRKTLCVWVTSWTSCFFHRTLFLLERTDGQTVVIQTWVFGRHFSTVNKVNVSLQSKQQNIYCQWTNLSFQQILEFWRTYVYHHKPGSFTVLFWRNFIDETLMMGSVVILSNVIWKYVFGKSAELSEPLF